MENKKLKQNHVYFLATITFLFIGLLLLPLSQAQEIATLYADIEINVDTTGKVTISGDTNHPTLRTFMNDSYTSKKGSVWTLNISIQELFSVVYYTLHLPKEVSITYMRLPQLGRIEHADDGIRLIGTAKNQPLKIVVQYKQNQEPLQNKSGVKYGVIGAGILLILLGIGILTLVGKKNRTEKKNQEISYANVQEEKRHKYQELGKQQHAALDQEETQERGEVATKQYHEEIFHPRQQQILEKIKKNNGKIIQAQLEKELGIPKASLSRHLSALERKGIISKKPSGMSNTIMLRLQNEENNRN
ncbi:MAG: MarR family transcriptional regulator [Candidatus Woesearchaeota archaeon]